MSWFPPPIRIETRVFARLPDTLRRPAPTAWAAANKAGATVDSFLEGPVFDDEGNLFLVDIPNGRILVVDPEGEWREVAEYEGWPNGMRRTAAGKLIVADYARGLILVDPRNGTAAALLPTIRSEGFKGLNDLTVGPDGEICFTDQGQTGMHDPTGRVYRLCRDGRLDCLLDTCPSPNGLVFNKAGTHLYIGLTRACQVWRVPVTRDTTVSKAQVFVQLNGGVSGPDGLAIDEDDNLAICDPGHGCVWVVDAYGVPLYRVVSCAGRTITNLAYGGLDGRKLFMTDSERGQLLVADMPVAGRPLRVWEESHG